MSKDPKIRKIYYHGKKAYRPVNHDLYVGWEEDTETVIVEAEPTHRWRGGKINFALWDQICAFMRWSQKTYKAESMLFLFYNTVTNEWAAGVFPQEHMGMTVKMLPNHPLYAEDRKKFGKDWVQLGTVHHHCTSSAFQSSVDKDDECNRDGVHITLGKMEEFSLDTDIRQVFDGIQSKSRMIDWVALPDFLSGVPKNVVNGFHDICIKTAGSSEAFPKEWTERTFKPEPPKYTGHNILGGHDFFEGSEFGMGTMDSGKKDEKNTAAGTNKSNIAVPHNQHVSEKAWHENYTQRQTEKIVNILSKLSLTPSEAVILLNMYPTTHKMTNEQTEIRRALLDMMQKEGVPYHYGETLMKDIVNKARSAPMVVV